ncbi:MAG: XRE family transcriptional regulator, partial [Ruminococcus sp.]|nr:XRE family transcriptional regulator [Ruminococcus sp.]
MCILSVVPVTLFSEVFNNDNSDIIGTVIMFALIAGGVFFIVRTSSTKSGFSKLLEEDNFTREKKSREKNNVGSATGSYWLIVTAGYIAYSFITFDWGRSWIIFPVAGLLTPIVYQIEKKIKSK